MGEEQKMEPKMDFPESRLSALDKKSAQWTLLGYRWLKPGKWSQNSPMVANWRQQPALDN